MRSEDEKFLRRFNSEFEKLFPNCAKLEEVISAVADGKLPIERKGPNTTLKIDDEAVKEIEKTLPYLYKIIEKPSSFIKIYEDKTFVPTAKRINSKAIAHLSRDSNDWFAKTFLTVIPKNILSDMTEETFDLYENRFVVTLIDKILDVVTDERIKYEKMYERFNNEKIQEKLKKRGYIRIQGEFSKSLLKQKSGDTDLSNSELSIYLREQIEPLEKKIRHMKRTKLYSELRKCHRVRNPMQKTNILTFDPRYNSAYRLWEYLDKRPKEEAIALDDPSENHLYYTLFALVTTICALKDIGFIHQGGEIRTGKSSLSLDKTVWKKGKDIIQLSFLNKKMALNYCTDSVKDKWDQIAVTPDFYIDFEDKSMAEVREKSDDILAKLMPNKKNEDVSIFYFISVDIPKCSNDNDWGEKIYRRFFNIGDNYHDEEKCIEKLSFYRSGVLIISPENFQVNFLRIQRLLNSRILRNKRKNLEDKFCPICGGKNIRRLKEDEIICNDCGHYVSISDCNCGTKFLWIKYIEDDFLEDKEITDIFDTTQHYYNKLMRAENTMGAFAITSFSIEKDTPNTWKLYSLCPKCGRKLGADQN